MALTKSKRRIRIKRRIRKNIAGTTERPRLSVFRSNRGMYAQIIDDTTGKTLVSTASKREDKSDKSKSDIAGEAGKDLAAKAKEAGINKVVFDRNGYRYHGRVRAFAEAAREGGLEF